MPVNQQGIAVRRRLDLTGAWRPEATLRAVFFAIGVVGLCIPALAAALPVPAGTEAGEVVVAYYCHQTVRCETCLTAERLIGDLLRTDFADRVEAKRLLWLPLDYEQPENVAYAEIFGLKGGPAFVLGRWRVGRLVEWHEIVEIWDLADNATGLIELTRDQVELFLQAEKWHAAMDSIRAAQAPRAPATGAAPSPGPGTQGSR